MNANSNKVTVVKLNENREETWRYDGFILMQDENSILIEAYFNREDLPFHGILLQENDRFVERYYEDRWYNIFEIHDRDDDRLKGWYCNVTTPAKFSAGKITYIDLALDVLVYPNNEYLILDRDEFEELALDEASRQRAITALDTLISMAENGRLKTAVSYEKETR